MSESLKQQIQEDMKTAMRAQDKQRLSAIRLILAAVKQIEVDERIVVDDERLLTILSNKMVKQRRDSIAQYQAGNRPDLVELENFELELILQYMPAQLTEAEIIDMIHAAIATVGATSAKDMGKVMAELKSKLQGRADIAAVSAKVKELLGVSTHY